jgi:hypothetical protein
MVRTHTPTRSDFSHPDQRQQISSITQPTSVAIRRRLRISPFWRHFLEMLAVMWIGMAAGMPVFRAIYGLSSTSQAYRLYPWQSVLAMGLSMAVPMAAWMLVRGHGWRNSAEMAAAMLVPAIPFIILCSLHVLGGGPANRIYMVLSIPAMLALMLYRRDAYSVPMPAPWHRHPRP